MDISSLTVVELKSILEKIPGEIKRREKEEKKRIRQELEELAAKSGYSLDELLGESTEKKTRKSGGAVAVKYRHPQDVSLAWTGRGRQPKWIGVFLAAGGSMDQLKV